MKPKLTVVLLLLLLPATSQAFYFVQGFNHSQRQQDGVRFGYHNQNPDLFWRTYLSYSPSLNKVLDDDQYGKTDLSLDWMIPLPGTYSSVFVGGTLNQRGARSVQAGVSVLKYLELGWHWREGKTNSYLGVNLSF